MTIRHALSLLPSFLLLAIGPPRLMARIVHVPADSATIQGAIDGADVGDTVMIATGTYHESGIVFRGKGIIVMSTDPSDPAVVAATTVDADSQGTVFLFESEEDSTAVLDGLTITGGAWSTGAGIWIGGIHGREAPTITRNVITGNHASSCGGGIYCSSDVSPRIAGNTIRENSAALGGGGIDIYRASPEIEGNRIEGNRGESGAGIWAVSAAPTLEDNTICANVAEGDGGGIDIFYCDDVTIRNNVISGNRAGNAGGGISSTLSSTVRVVGNLILANSADSTGGGIDCDFQTNMTIHNDTLLRNTSSRGGGIGTHGRSYASIKNTILWDDSAAGGPEIWVGDIIIGPSTLRIEFSDVENGEAAVRVDRGSFLIWGSGMIQENPLFLDPDRGGAFLRVDSPCVDSGDAAVSDGCVPPGLGTLRSDMGAFGGADNCGWPETAVDLILFPGGSPRVARGDTFVFAALFWNTLGTAAEGEYWLSLLPPGGGGEMLIPGAFLGDPNPLPGEIPANASLDFFNEITVPAAVDTGTYRVIGRIGTGPDLVIDEESFDLRVIE